MPDVVTRRPGLTRRTAKLATIFINDDSEIAYRQLRTIFEAARCRTKGQRPRPEAILREVSGDA